VQALQRATQTLQVYTGGPTVDPQCLTALATAVRDHERVRFNYTARDKAPSRREAEPHSLVNAGRRWYLLAWDRKRDDWRTFRIDRLERPAATGVRFTAREVPGKDAAAFVRRSVASMPNRYEAVVTLHCAADEVFDQRLHHWGTITPIDGHRCEYRTGDDDLRWLGLRIATLGVDFEVHEPPELVAHLQGLAQRLADGCGAR